MPKRTGSRPSRRRASSAPLIVEALLLSPLASHAQDGRMTLEDQQAELNKAAGRSQ